MVVVSYILASVSVFALNYISTYAVSGKNLVASFKQPACLTCSQPSQPAGKPLFPQLKFEIRTEKMIRLLLYSIYLHAWIYAAVKLQPPPVIIWCRVCNSFWLKVNVPQMVAVGVVVEERSSHFSAYLKAVDTHSAVGYPPLQFFDHALIDKKSLSLRACVLFLFFHKKWWISLRDSWVRKRVSMCVRIFLFLWYVIKLRRQK